MSCHLLALLDAGTLGTRTEPPRAPSRVPAKPQQSSASDSTGTRGTFGTLKIKQLDTVEFAGYPLSDALADAYAERVAICTADGIREADARRTAALEIGEAFVRAFNLGIAA